MTTPKPAGLSAEAIAKRLAKYPKPLLIAWLLSDRVFRVGEPDLAALERFALDRELKATEAALSELAKLIEKAACGGGSPRALTDLHRRHTALFDRSSELHKRYMATFDREPGA
ncbi:hypothetical protein SAMN06265365_1884 [Tistlia consotensis]|uniref:hypothetical protein n=1 Tax=Tistlia consotensis TaxID=1321365 RepID=UPI000B7508B4|nr:hypothetical protein [Tistlia consotensis]SNS43870.1 hypothetical protein SAMN06265365_1884 [Tistlia consotensis]